MFWSFGTAMMVAVNLISSAFADDANLVTFPPIVEYSLPVTAKAMLHASMPIPPSDPSEYNCHMESSLGFWLLFIARCHFSVIQMWRYFLSGPDAFAGCSSLLLSGFIGFGSQLFADVLDIVTVDFSFSS